MRSLLLWSLLVCVGPSRAHEGHDHGTVEVPLQKGGIMRSLETVHLELVYKDNLIQIYPFKVGQKNSGKLQSAEISKFPVSATVELPRMKALPIVLTPKSDHWEAGFDSKGAHRFTVTLKIQQGGHEDRVKWTVEPQNGG